MHLISKSKRGPAYTKRTSVQDYFPYYQYSLCENIKLCKYDIFFLNEVFKILRGNQVLKTSVKY